MSWQAIVAFATIGLTVVGAAWKLSGKLTETQGAIGEIRTDVADVKSDVVAVNERIDNHMTREEAASTEQQRVLTSLVASVSFIAGRVGADPPEV